MKKLTLILAVVLAVAMMLPMAVSADSHGIKPNDPVTMPFATPVIDANIDAGEGWSAPALFNNDTVGYFWAHQTLTTTANLYFAYDNTGIYVAADITECDYVEALDQNGNPAVYAGNYFIASTGEDDLDIEDGVNTYGYNGDVFAFMIDPLGQFSDAGFNGNEDFTAWYCVGLFEDGTTKMYRSKVNDGEITNQVKVAAKTTEAGWLVEAMIPWEIIVKDAVDMGFGDVNVTEEDMIAAAATSRAAVMYHDRFFDSEAEMTDTWGRYITVAEVTAAGIPGQISSGDCVSAYGLVLVNGESGSTDDTTTAPAGDDTTTAPAGDDTTTAPAGDDTTKASDTTKAGATTTKKPATTTKAASTGKPSTGTSSTQTFDAGIAVAVGALAVSAIGFVGVKKSKRK